jgi:Fe-S-cluster containining protein
MDLSLLKELQSKFKCNRCGKCCAVGGDMCLIVEDIFSMSRCLDIAVMEFLDQYVVDRVDKDDPLYFKTTRPCIFLDKYSNECLVNDGKPMACRQYPFMLYARGGCNLDAVLTCPVAVKMLEDHLKGVE